MSKILEKAFDASKKIVRSIFLGSPNLFTTSDLNRQIEAFKYQMDAIDEKTGMRISQPRLTTSLSGGTLRVTFSHELIQFKGCEFQIPAKELSINLTSSAPIAYLVLTAEKQVVTYDMDASHEIAGAKFEDGTSMASANQVRYINEALVLTHAVKGENYIGMVVRFRLENGKLYVDNNYVDMDLSLCLDKSSSVGSSYNPDSGDAGYPVISGDSYDLAFSKITNFLGSGKTYKGSWGVTDVSPALWDDTIVDTLGPKCSIRVLGPFVLITLDELDVPENMDLLLFESFKNATGLCVVFKDIPDNMRPNKFLGVMSSIRNGLISSTGSGSSRALDLQVGATDFFKASQGSVYYNTLEVHSLSLSDVNIITESPHFKEGASMAVTLVYLRKDFS